VRELATLLCDAGGGEQPGEVVILWGERLTAGSDGAAGARALLSIAQQLSLAGTNGAGLLELPACANGRGLREAGVLPNAAAGLSEPEIAGGRDARAIAEGLASGELTALHLLHCDPLRELPDRELWERALGAAATVVVHSSFLTETVREHANVVFPAETYAEKEGTIVHPDGRLQRLRPAIAHPGEVRAEWEVLAELAARLGADPGYASARAVSAGLFAAVPFYAGLTLEEIGGRGVRWQERDAAGAFPTAAGAPADAAHAHAFNPTPELAGYRSVWDAVEVEFSPTLEFLFPHRAVLAQDLPQSVPSAEIEQVVSP
jgi:NADH-quinone oxidoreductase subunit G